MPVELKRPPVARKRMGSILVEKLRTIQDPARVAEKALINFEYTRGGLAWSLAAVLRELREKSFQKYFRGFFGKKLPRMRPQAGFRGGLTAASFLALTPRSSRGLGMRGSFSRRCSPGR